VGYKFLVFYYFIFVNLCYIYFIKWFSSAGSSFSFKNIGFLSYEGTWMELVGGMGAFYFFINNNKIALLLDGLRLGIVLFLSFVFIISILFPSCLTLARTHSETQSHICSHTYMFTSILAYKYFLLTHTPISVT